MMRFALASALALSFTALGLACGAGEAPPPSSPADEAASARPAAGPRAKATQLSRSGVRRVVSGGFGRFLQSVEVDDRPAFRDGKFLGFRLTELRGDLEACDLQRGDVITRVNGRAIERPEEAQAVFLALLTAKELVVDYERGGEGRRLVLPIVDDGGPEASAPADSQPSQAPQPPQPPPAAAPAPTTTPDVPPAIAPAPTPPPPAAPAPKPAKKPAKKPAAKPSKD
ncbi:MAG TPA: hypothetical protein PK141_14120 [Polyangiaceae bacterium]|nr:hypothetical protein [Polyangiaceae bacterium]